MNTPQRQRILASLGGLLFVSLAITACGDDGSSKSTANNPTVNNGGGGTDNTNCQERCVTKATSCGAPADQAATSCQQDYCAGTQTEAYVACLEGVSCQTTGDPEGLKAMCGYTTPGGGGTDQNCSGYPKCSGNGVETCEIVDGIRVTQTSLCGTNESCSNGTCQQNACIASGRTGCNAQNNPSNCCDDRQTCSGNGNSAGETICCIPFNSPCTMDSECCNNDTGWACVEGACTLTF